MRDIGLNIPFMLSAIFLGSAVVAVIVIWDGAGIWLPAFLYIQDLSFALAVTVLTGLLFFLPTWIACYRRHPSQLAIFALDLLAGWTVLGWLIALIWSLAGTSSSRTIACPHCAEQIQPKAKICRFCGLPVTGASTEVTA